MTTRAELVDIIGEEAVEALIAWRPGVEWRVPKALDRISPVIGPRAAYALRDELGGAMVAIPRAAPYKHLDRGRVAALDAMGLSAGEIALRLGCTTRTVYRARAALRRQRA